jgi:hypothetical protein
MKNPLSVHCAARFPIPMIIGLQHHNRVQPGVDESVHRQAPGRVER